MYPDLHHPQNHVNDYDSILLTNYDGVVLSYLLSQQQFSILDTSSLFSAETTNATASNKEAMKEEKNKKIQAAKKPRKRKKHRHSKICTVQGTIDRRMRLSVPIARKFFDLQDILCFDKASKTIDWLFKKSKSAIMELKQHYLVSLPTCSSLDLSSTSVESNNEVVGKNKKKKMSSSRSRVRKRSRDKARGRARTEEKIRMRSSCQGNDQDEGNSRDIGLLCFGELVEQGQMKRNESDGHESFMGIRSIEDRSSSWPSFQADGCEFRRFYLEFDAKI